MIHRSKWDTEYVIVPNSLVNNPNLDWRDIGLLVYLLSKPEKWSVSAAQLTKEKKAGRDQVWKILNVLVEEGYAVREKKQNGKMDYWIFDKPNTGNPCLESPNTENPNTENPSLGKSDTIKYRDNNKVKNNINIGDKSPTITEVIDLYHKMLPGLPEVAKVTKTRKGLFRQRIREDLKTIVEWENYFDWVSQSEFLMGRSEPTNGRPPFRADFEWLIRPTNFTKITESKYHG